MIRLIALLLTVLTGFTGLVYEVAWQRYLATLLGSHGEATAAVLGIFLGGLAVGYAVASRWLIASRSLADDECAPFARRDVRPKTNTATASPEEGHPDGGLGFLRFECEAIFK